MSKTYHIAFPSDGDATKAYWDMRARVSAIGGTAHVSPSLGHGTAYVVVGVPDEVEADRVNGATAPHTGTEVIDDPVATDLLTPAEHNDGWEANYLDEEGDDDLPFDDDDDEEDDEGWDDLDDALFLDDEEDEDDEPEEDSGDEPGEDSGSEGAAQGPASGETASLGSTADSAE